MNVAKADVLRSNHEVKILKSDLLPSKYNYNPNLSKVGSSDIATADSKHFQKNRSEQNMGIVGGEHSVKDQGTRLSDAVGEDEFASPS